MTTTTINKINKPVLKVGSKGEAVKELQKLLFDNGMFVVDCNPLSADEAIDGVFGSKTEDAVKVFQHKMFLVEDGIVGNKTWQALYNGAPVDMPTLKKGSTGELVKQMQSRMAHNYGVNPDGIFGSETEKKVKELQKNTGLTVDGIVGDRTWFELSKNFSLFTYC